MPGDPGATVVTCLRAFYFCTQGCGCVAHPAFPTPSVFLGEGFMHDSGASRRETADSHLKLALPNALRSPPGRSQCGRLEDDRLAAHPPRLAALALPRQ